MPSLWASCWLVTAGVLLSLALGGEALSQGEASGEYRAYPLKHKAAADLEKVLKELLGSSGESTDMLVDRAKNQLLIRGPEAAQQIARQLIESLDRPPQAPLAAPAKPQVKSYRCVEGREAETVARLRTLFGPRGDVRVAADPQSGQILVVAPAEVQAEIPRHIPAPPAPGTLAARSVRSGDGSQSASVFVALSRVATAQAETALRELFGGRLVPVPDGGIGQRKYRFADAAGGRVELVFEERRRGVTIHGPAPLAQQFARLVQSIDAGQAAGGRMVRLVPLRHADPADVRKAVDAYRSGSGSGPAPRGRTPGPAPGGQSGRPRSRGIELVSYLFQRGEGEAAAEPAPPGGAAPAAPAEEAMPEALPPKEAEEDRRGRLRELGVDVDIETLPDLGVIILRGRERDVEEVRRIIEEIERISAETQPAIEIHYLRHVDGEALLVVMRQVQADLLSGRQGRVTLIPLVKPNALLLIGWGDAVKAAKEFIRKLDRPVDAKTQQRTFHLRHASASAVQRTLEDFFAGRDGGLAPRPSITADPRTNALFVQGAPSDLEEVALLLERLDVARTSAVMQTRIFRLENTLAADLSATLTSAIETARGGGPAAARSAALELLSVKGEKILKSGILSDVRITPDPRLNILIVSGPAESMDLLAALIRELDAPGFVAQIKVFTLSNADATAMMNMLRLLLPGQVGGVGPQLSAAEGEPSTIGLRFSVDPRTNSIVAVGSEGNLRIIDALLARLDLLDVQQRKTSVHRLKNAPARDVANSVNLFLRSERQVQAVPGTISPFQQIESEVIVVPEEVSNSLIISATPRFYKDIEKLVNDLDKQPPQVMIQVLIAEVSLRDTDEFGVELGLQDSILFDRSLLSGNLQAQTTTQQFSTPSGIITSTTQNFPAATLTPGFDFNGKTLGNSASNKAAQGSHRLGEQSLSNFNMGRVNSELGFGGLVLSASSESVSVLIRALKESQRLEVLGRPHIMTLDNQSAFIQIGKRVPRIAGTQVNQIGQVNTITEENVGLILGVTPRISPEGMVVMEIDAERSEVGPESEGIPISISATGEIIRSPSINTTMAQTTVSAADGETIVLGGLITKNTTRAERKVPYLADVPLVGNLFRYDMLQVKRTELLIVLTPHVVAGPEDGERIKRVESARMHWCLEDVHQIHGDGGLGQAGGVAPVIYPDTNPRGEVPPPQGPKKSPAGEKGQGPADGKSPPPGQPLPDLGPGAEGAASSRAGHFPEGPTLANPLRVPGPPGPVGPRSDPPLPPGLAEPAVYSQGSVPGG